MSSISKGAVAAVVAAGLLGVGGGALAIELGGSDGGGGSSAGTAPSVSATPGGRSTSPSASPSARPSASQGSSGAGAIPSSSTQPSASSGGAGSSTVGECTDGDLEASYQGTDAGAGHRFGMIVLTNIGSSPCRTGGFGGLSYVGGGDGTQVGAPADRDGSAKKVVLQPGERVFSEVDETVAANYPAADCDPQPVDGFRVYVPNSQRAQFVEHETTGCASMDVHLLTHRAYRRL